MSIEQQTRKKKMLSEPYCEALFAALVGMSWRRIIIYNFASLQPKKIKVFLEFLLFPWLSSAELSDEAK